MGSMIFDLPPDLPDDARRELERASVAGGQDGMPFPTEARLSPTRLTLHRTVEESGTLLAPWRVDGVGQLMAGSATLMERPAPYHLPLELARGKVNQVRNQAVDWATGGLVLPDALTGQMRAATVGFGRAVSRLPDPEAARLADAVLRDGYDAARQLVQTYMKQVFHVRHSRQPRLETALSCRLQAQPPAGPLGDALADAFNAVVVPLSWRTIEPTEGSFDWAAHDALVEWAVGRGLRVIGGPLVDFAGRDLPDWLWAREPDLLSRHGALADYVDRAVRRYGSTIRTWQVTAGSNCAGVLAHRDEELLWLTVRMAEAVRRVDPQLEVIVGLSQPWGDYLAEQERNQSPFLFADTLLRTGLKLTALDLEVVMGVSPRGSYCRDPLDLSRLLDLYALLGVPLHVTLGYPSAAEAPPAADPDQRAGAGWWRSGYTPEAQAEWATDFATLAVCKPFVRAVHWAHFTDAEPHHFPGCGVVDATGQPKPALHALTALRADHLK